MKTVLLIIARNQNECHRVFDYLLAGAHNNYRRQNFNGADQFTERSRNRYIAHLQIKTCTTFRGIAINISFMGCLSAYFLSIRQTYVKTARENVIIMGSPLDRYFYLHINSVFLSNNRFDRGAKFISSLREPLIRPGAQCKRGFRRNGSKLNEQSIRWVRKKYFRNCHSDVERYLCCQLSFYSIG